jgi:hypothetical protein
VLVAFLNRARISLRLTPLDLTQVRRAKRDATAMPVAAAPIRSKEAAIRA